MNSSESRDQPNRENIMQLNSMNVSVTPMDAQWFKSKVHEYISEFGVLNCVK